MPNPSIKKLFDYRQEKLKQLCSLEERKKTLRNRLETIDDQIEVIEAQINTLSDELNSRFNAMVPSIEVSCFGVDSKGEKIWGGVITFPSIETKFYRIVDGIEVFYQNPILNPVEFHARVKDVISEWLLNKPNLDEFADLTPDQKNVIKECIRNIDRENANFSRFPMNHLVD